GDQLHRPGDLADIPNRLAARDENTCAGHGSLSRFLLFSRVSAVEPFSQRALAFRGTLPQEQVDDADILVQVRPVDADAPADQPPVAALLGRRACQARKPTQRSNDRPPVSKVDGNLFLVQRHRDSLGERYLTRQRTHPSAPSTLPDVAQ